MPPLTKAQLRAAQIADLIALFTVAKAQLNPPQVDDRAWAIAIAIWREEQAWARHEGENARIATRRA